LPASGQIENRLKECLARKGWAILDCRLLHFDSYRDAYGAAAGDEMLRSAAVWIMEVVDGIGARDDFIGYSGGDSFLVLTEESRAATLEAKLKSRFENEIPGKYSYLDRQRGYSLVRNAIGSETRVPLMQLSIATVRSTERAFTDVRQITEAVAASRRKSV
jgi:GGDEF domain-containing protein